MEAEEICSVGISGSSMMIDLMMLLAVFFIWLSLKVPSFVSLNIQ